MTTTFVVLPAYNEERVIRTLLLALDAELGPRGVTYRAVIIDDGSTDATIAEAEAAVVQTDGRLPLTIVRHPENRGLGGALRTGIDWCLANGADDDIMVTLDADNTHPPALIPALLERVAAGADIAIASRYEPGAVVTGVPGRRLMLSEVARVVLHLGFPIPGVRDYTCCFRAIPLKTLRMAREVYGDELTTARGFEAVMDLLLRLRQLGIQASEIPLQLDYSDRVGRSKMRVFATIRRTGLLLVRRYVERFTTWSPGRVAKRLDEARARDARTQAPIALVGGEQDA
jgi:dolichol-phosphate mannosyltransferase